jgi:hypothetical protein
MGEFMNRRPTNTFADCFNDGGSIRTGWRIRYRTTSQDAEAHRTLSSKWREHMRLASRA